MVNVNVTYFRSASGTWYVSALVDSGMPFGGCWLPSDMVADDEIVSARLRSCRNGSRKQSVRRRRSKSDAVT